MTIKTDETDPNVLLSNLDKLHTTGLGIDRMKRNLGLDVEQIVDWCRQKVQLANASIVKKGKNWYVSLNDCIITINAYSYTIITAHKVNNK